MSRQQREFNEALQRRLSAMTPTCTGCDAAAKAEREAIVAWLRNDADKTEVEARCIVKNTTGNARQNAAEWDMLIGLKRGLADAIERGEHATKGEA